MPRIVTVGAAQLGPIALKESRADVVVRLIALMRQARDTGCDLVVYPELALTTFFPRWFAEDRAEMDRFFETEMPGPQTQPLFDEAKHLLRLCRRSSRQRDGGEHRCTGEGEAHPAEKRHRDLSPYRVRGTWPFDSALANCMPAIRKWYGTEPPRGMTCACAGDALGSRPVAPLQSAHRRRTPPDAAGIRHHFNTSIIVDKSGAIVAKYRKIHLPGHAEDESYRPFQHLEKRYFEPGDLGFGVWEVFGGRLGMCICNDRRWPETYRVMGLQGVEMILLGYNTPVHNPPTPEHDDLSLFHNQLVMQSGAYQNGTWVVGVAKAGPEEDVPMIAGTQIIAPSGQTVAEAATQGDELIFARCDLDLCNSYKANVFNFAKHREPASYRLIVETKGVVSPAEAQDIIRPRAEG